MWKSQHHFFTLASWSAFLSKLIQKNMCLHTYEENQYPKHDKRKDFLHKWLDIFELVPQWVSSVVEQWDFWGLTDKSYKDFSLKKTTINMKEE